MKDSMFLVMDCETGGVTPTTSLLSVCFMLCDQRLEVMDELELFLKPKNGEYTVTVSALQVNKIDLLKHDELAVTYEEGAAKLYNFLNQHFSSEMGHFVPVGKNVNFDVEMVSRHLLSSKSWNKFVSYRTYDLTSLIFYLKRVGKLERSAPDSLEELAHHLEFDYGLHTAHTARGDVLATLHVLKKLEELVPKPVTAPSSEELCSGSDEDIPF